MKRRWICNSYFLSLSSVRELLRCSTIILVAALISESSIAQTYSLVIGVDGIGPYGLNAAPTPNLDRLMRGDWADGYRGSVTYHGLSGGAIGTSTQQATLSGPGWSSIHTGVWQDQHGVTNNSFSGSRFFTHPSYLKTLESHIPNIYTAGVVSWNPINDKIFAPVPGQPDIDFRQGTNENDSLTTLTAIARLGGLQAAGNGAVFVHLDDVDIAGHVSGA